MPKLGTVLSILSALPMIACAESHAITLGSAVPAAGPIHQWGIVDGCDGAAIRTRAMIALHGPETPTTPVSLDWHLDPGTAVESADVDISAPAPYVVESCSDVGAPVVDDACFLVADRPVPSLAFTFSEPPTALPYRFQVYRFDVADLRVSADVEYGPWQENIVVVYRSEVSVYPWSRPNTDIRNRLVLHDAPLPGLEGTTDPARVLETDALAQGLTESEATSLIQAWREMVERGSRHEIDVYYWLPSAFLDLPRLDAGSARVSRVMLVHVCPS